MAKPGMSAAVKACRAGKWAEHRRSSSGTPLPHFGEPAAPHALARDLYALHGSVSMSRSKNDDRIEGQRGKGLQINAYGAQQPGDAQLRAQSGTASSTGATSHCQPRLRSGSAAIRHDLQIVHGRSSSAPDRLRADQRPRATSRGRRLAAAGPRMINTDEPRLTFNGRGDRGSNAHATRLGIDFASHKIWPGRGLSHQARRRLSPVSALQSIGLAGADAIAPVEHLAVAPGTQPPKPLI